MKYLVGYDDNDGEYSFELIDVDVGDEAGVLAAAKMFASDNSAGNCRLVVYAIGAGPFKVVAKLEPAPYVTEMAPGKSKS